MYITMYPALPISILLTHNSGENSLEFCSLDARNTFFFNYARSAIWNILALLRLSHQDNILAPAYTCDTVIRPMVNYGIKIKYFQIDRNLRLSTEELEAKIDQRTRAIYIIHYFGFPDRIEEIQQLCQKKGIFLLEDCAHALFSKTENGMLGNYGYASIYSLRKFLPIPDGGALKINDENFNNRPELRENGSFTTYKETYKLLQRYINQKLGINHHRLMEKSKQTDINGDPGNSMEEKYDIGMSHISNGIITRINVTEVIKTRQINFRFWQEMVPRLPGLVPIFSDCPDNVCPFSFPVLVMDNRDRLANGLRKYGLFLERTFRHSPFKNAPGLINSEESFDDTKFIADRILGLPVHQGINIRSLEKAYKVLTKLL